MSIEVHVKRALDSCALRAELTVGNGRIAILGASGSGKTMTLKCVAGTERPDSGRIVIDGRCAFDSARGIDAKPQERGCGFLFQQYALFPHMTVRENARAVARHARGSAFRGDRAGADSAAERMLERLELDSCADQRPARLSGGQQQRLALARILLSNPRAILLDEPLSALDPYLRASVERELADILRDFPGTVLHVTHNLDEAFRMCDQIAVMEAGMITQTGDKRAVFERPATVGAARLTGCENIAPATRAGARRVAVPSWGIVLETAEPTPEGLSCVGVRAGNIRPARTGEDANVIDFELTPLASSPFTEEWSATALTAPGSAGGSRDSRGFLRVKGFPTGGAPVGSSATRGLPNAPRGQRRERLCIPADSLLLFSR